MSRIAASRASCAASTASPTTKDSTPRAPPRTGPVSPSAVRRGARAAGAFAAAPEVVPAAGRDAVRFGGEGAAFALDPAAFAVFTAFVSPPAFAPPFRVVVVRSLAIAHLENNS
jgi:hypothetical protein